MPSADSGHRPDPGGDSGRHRCVFDSWSKVLLGIPGAVLAVPTIAILQVLFTEWLATREAGH